MTPTTKKTPEPEETTSADGLDVTSCRDIEELVRERLIAHSLKEDGTLPKQAAKETAAEDFDYFAFYPYGYLY